MSREFREREQSAILQLPEAANLIGHSVSWLRAACVAGWGPKYSVINGRRVFERDELIEWVRSNPSAPCKGDEPNTEAVSA